MKRHPLFAYGLLAGWITLLVIASQPNLASAAKLVTPAAIADASGPGFPLQRKAGNPPDPQYDAPVAIDGDPETFCCLLDDTPEGKRKDCIPVGGNSPITGHIVFDLGEPMLVSGASLVSRKSVGGLNPQAVDFYFFADDDPAEHPVADDIEGDPGIELLLSHEFERIPGGQSRSVFWKGVVARYIGMRVNSSHVSRGDGSHWNFQIAEMGVFAARRPRGIEPGSRVPEIYTKRDGLIETLLATREQYDRWLAPDPEASESEPAPAEVDNQAANGKALSAAEQGYATTPTPSAEPNPGTEAVVGQAEKIWERVRDDFSAEKYPLLTYVHHSWFAEHGWLAHADSVEFEKRLIGRALDEAEASGEALRRELNSLVGSGAAADDWRWLDLCNRASALALAVRPMDSLAAAIDDLAGSFAERYRAEEYRERLARLRRRSVEITAAGPGVKPAQLGAIEADLEQLKRDALVLSNPLLSPGKLLFVKRFTYSPSHYYAHFINGIRKPGGNVCVLSLPDGEVSEVFDELGEGVVGRLDLSFDAERTVFDYKSAPDVGFRIYEGRVDGSGLRQLTRDPTDEPQRIQTFGHYPGKDGWNVYNHQTNDMHPCYLPDGGICFTSTRCERGILCDASDRLPVNVLHRIDADGGNLNLLSEGALSESTPSVMNDGRILYTRWEYVDKGVIAVHALWAMRPDGTGSCEIFGNQHEFPPVFIQGRAVPEHNNLFVSLCTMHHPFAVGPIMRIDINRDIRTLDPLTNLTPDTSLSVAGVGGFRRGEFYTHWKNGRWVKDNQGPLFADPYPLADPTTGAGAGKYFLVSCNPDQPHNHSTAYGLWLIDTFGNRVPIYSDPEISCWQPMPLRPRQRPPVIAPTPSHTMAESKAKADHPASDREPPSVAASRAAAAQATGEATVVLTDIYQGLEGIERGEVKYLRVMEQVARPWAARRFWEHGIALGQHAPISLYAHIFVKVHHGIVPVAEDGSAHFVVPADRNIFFQALDENLMEVQRMRTFVNFQPGETRSCIGCHEPRSQAPPRRFPLALGRPADHPAAQPGESVPRPIDYVADVQPILDRHCVRCHGGEKTEASLDLRGELTTFFNRSYETLMRDKWVTYIQEFIGPQPRAQKTNVAQLPPKTLGSHGSRLIALLREGHENVELSAAEWARLITWADANSPYYGTYFGRKNIAYREHPDFRPTATLESAYGVPNVWPEAARRLLVPDAQ